jgi:hypothetical protein
MLTGKKLGRALNEQAVSAAGMASPASYAKGGKVRKTGLAKVHKGERVLTKGQAGLLKKILG